LELRNSVWSKEICDRIEAVRGTSDHHGDRGDPDIYDLPIED
jgi:hypothetical protein